FCSAAIPRRRTDRCRHEPNQVRTEKALPDAAVATDRGSMVSALFPRPGSLSEPRPSGSGLTVSEPRPSGSGWARFLTVAALLLRTPRSLTVAALLFFLAGVIFNLESCSTRLPAGREPGCPGWGG